MNPVRVKAAAFGLVIVGALLTVPQQAMAGDLDCSDFASQAEAQENLTPGDPDGLDADGDGIACESNPCPCSTATGDDGEGGDPKPAPPAPPPYRLSKSAARTEAKQLARRFVRRNARVESLAFNGCRRLAVRRIDCNLTARGRTVNSSTVCRLRVAVRARNRRPAGRLTPRCATRTTLRLTIARALPPIRARASELADKPVPIVDLERASAVAIRGLAEWMQPAISPSGIQEECFALMEAELSRNGSVAVKLIESDCRSVPTA